MLASLHWLQHQVFTLLSEFLTKILTTTHNESWVIIVHSDFILNYAFWKSAGFYADKGCPDEEMESVAVIICFENSENSMWPIVGRI